MTPEEARALIACVVFAAEETVCPDVAWDAAKRLARDMELPPIPENGNYEFSEFYSWQQIR